MLKQIIRNRRNKKIYSIMKKLDGAAVRTPDQGIKLQETLFSMLGSILPSHLYKYQSGKGHTIDNFINGHLYLNAPENYNDPTDSMAYVNADNTVQKILSIDSHWFSQLKKEGYFEDEKMEEIYKRVEMINYANSTINYVRSRVKTVCLSEIIDSPLMWSHYANYHKGFALRYNMHNYQMTECDNCDCGKFCYSEGFPVFPVIYKDKRYDMSMYAVIRAIHKEAYDSNIINSDIYAGGYDDIPIPLTSCLQKSKEWEYEKEWRFLCFDTEKEFVQIEPDALYLGARIGVDLAMQLVTIAKEKKIPIYKMNIDYFEPSFILDYADWTDYSKEEVIEDIIETDNDASG